MAGGNKALSLYKSILRAHDRFLPASMRQLGDAYVKSEFRLHRTAKPEQAAQFVTEWEGYLRHVERTGRGNQSADVGLMDDGRRRDPSSSSPPTTQKNEGLSFGRSVPSDVSFSEEQEGQLEKLREEAAKAGADLGR